MVVQTRIVCRNTESIAACETSYKIMSKNVLIFSGIIILVLDSSTYIYFLYEKDCYNESYMKIYIAGKISKDSVFGTHDWRDSFCETVEKLSGIKLENLDPTKVGMNQNDPQLVFGGDSYLISQCDVLIVYLSDDISIGGSQEILIAKYFKKPVIGLSRFGGKFNGSDKEYYGKLVKNYKDPFVFTTCDLVCKTVDEVAESLKALSTISPKSLDIIPESIQYYLATYKHE